MNGLAGKRIALLEARLGGELAKLVERRGGEAFSFPALREQTIDAGDEVAQLINDLYAGAFAFIIFQTGVGVSTLFKEADRLGRLAALLVALKTVTTVCRGPKPAAALARQGIKPSVNTREPHTTVELLEAVASIGPTCSAALRALGVEPRLEPEHPKMAPLVAALAEYFDNH